MIVMMMAMGVIMLAMVAIMLAMVVRMLAMVVRMLAMVVMMMVLVIVAPSCVDSFAINLFIIVLLNMSMYYMRDITTGTGWHQADRYAHDHSSCISQLS